MPTRDRPQSAIDLEAHRRTCCAAGDENVRFLQNGRILLTVNGAKFMRADERADRSPLNQFGAVFLPGEDRKHAQVERRGRLRNG